MKNEIQKLSKIVDWMYENSPEGVEILYVEEAFDRLYRCIENLEMSEEEEFEFRCLEYEYELNYFYKFIHPESQMAEVINYILGSLNGILFQANLHQRIKKLTERIFIVGIKAAEEQALELMNLKIIPNQLAWLWEAYAEEYVKRGKFRKAFQYYWYAMDIYLFVTENEDEDEQKRIFYDGSSFLYISDIIYRIYNKATKQCHCWEECIKEFLKRWEKLKAYNYSYLYLAGAQYERALELEKPEKMLKMSLNTLRQLSPDDCSDMGYTIECNILYYLKEYQEVLKIYKKAKDKYGEAIVAGQCWRAALFAALEIMRESSGNIEKLEEVLNEAVDCYLKVPTSMLDSAKRYIPIFDFYLKYKEKQYIQIALIELFFDLVEVSSELMEKLCFDDESVDLGYYTSLSSLYYLLNDDMEEVKYRIALFDARHMNDPNEGKVLDEYLGKANGEKYNKRRGQLKRWKYDNTIIFLKSFTTKVDSLPMWVQYTDEGKGCFIRISQEMFKKGQKLVESREDMEINNLRNEESYCLYNVAYFDGQKFCTSNGKDVTTYINAMQKIYLQILKVIDNCTEEIKDDVEEVVNCILNRVQYLIKKDDYKNEEEVRVFFIRNGNEKDIKESKCIEGGVPRIYLQLKVSTIIKEIILGPKIGNGYDKVPYIYWKLQKISEQQPVSVSQSAIEYV